jgi:rubrerythrin
LLLIPKLFNILVGMVFRGACLMAETGEQQARLKELLRSAVEDEESEAAAYYRLSRIKGPREVREILRSIAEDSVVHAEVMRGLLRAAERIESMRGVGGVEEVDLLEELRAHRSIEILAGASYSDLKKLADVGSMKAVLEAIEREEEKHARLVRALIERLERERQ